MRKPNFNFTSEYIILMATVLILPLIFPYSGFAKLTQFAFVLLLLMATGMYFSFRKRLLLTLGSFWLFFTITYLTAFIGFQRNYYLNWEGTKISFIAGLLGMMVTGLSLLARKYWWLLFSFLLPVVTVSGFWSTFFFYRRRVRFQDAPESWDFLMQFVTTLLEERETNSHLLAWGILGLGTAIVLKGLTVLLLKCFEKKLSPENPIVLLPPNSPNSNEISLKSSKSNTSNIWQVIISSSKLFQKQNVNSRQTENEEKGQ